VAEDALSAEVQQFISRFIQSVEHLEILLMLNSNREKSFSVHDVFRQIQSSEKSVSEGLSFFAQEGLVITRDGMHRLTSDAEALRLVTELGKAYRERRVTVIGLIYTRPSDRIQSFAAAFIFRKKE
jgi:hypothetical protein